MAREIAEFSGFSQGMTYSFESPRVFDKMMIPEDSALRETVEISNPWARDFSVMRTTSPKRDADLPVDQLQPPQQGRAPVRAGQRVPSQVLPLTELPDERMQFHPGDVRGWRFLHHEGRGGGIL